MGIVPIRNNRNLFILRAIDHYTKWMGPGLSKRSQQRRLVKQ